MHLVISRSLAGFDASWSPAPSGEAPEIVKINASSARPQQSSIHYSVLR